LNLGAGGIEYEDYLSVDFYDKRAHVLMDITKLDFEDNSIGEILASHVFEHLNPYHAFDILVNWFRVLDNARSVPDYVGFCNSCIAHEQTAIFEWTSPVARIVLAYPKDELKLLHVRDNVTGDYKKRSFLDDLARKYNIPMVDDRDDLVDMLKTEEGVLRYIEETEGVEGIVVQFENGDMVKIKTKWYMERHHAMIFVRERDIAEMALNETLDDLKAFYVGEKIDITEINEIETRVVAEIDKLIWEVNRVVGSAGLMDRKALAMKYSAQGENHPLFKLIMHKWEGKDPDYKGFYERNYLHLIPLRQLNLLQTTAETDE
jgi:RNA ligase